MGKSIIVCLLAGIIIPLSPGPGFAEDALKDVKAGWYQELVYEQELLNPPALCYDRATDSLIVVTIRDDTATVSPIPVPTPGGWTIWLKSRR